VNKRNPSLIGRINEAQQRVIELFLRQCKYGEQTKRLPEGFAACGQFVGGQAEAIPQFGLHGLSAAVRVLGPCQSEDCRATVPQIVSYCEACFEANPKVHLETNLHVRQDDKRNVIKLGELLFGLWFITTAQAERDQLIGHIATLLQDSLIDGRGWGYFLGDKVAELLPTAYAVRGLAQNGYDTDAPRRFLLENLTARKHSANSSTADLTTAVACTYCLSFCPSAPGVPDSVLKETFLSVWPPLEPLLAEDIEQNLEYWGELTYYVRIPWQLYLLALASEYSSWRFAGFRAQRCLNRVVDALRLGSFKYPYSGTYLSSRTHSIAYEVLAEIKERTRHLLWLRVAYFIDSIRVFIGSRAVRRLATILALLAISYAVWLWAETGKVSDLAPNFVSGIVILLLAWGRR